MSNDFSFIGMLLHLLWSTSISQLSQKLFTTQKKIAPACRSTATEWDPAHTGNCGLRKTPESGKGDFLRLNSFCSGLWALRLMGCWLGVGVPPPPSLIPFRLTAFQQGEELTGNLFIFAMPLTVTSVCTHRVLFFFVCAMHMNCE